jgi:hypothetical protein
VLAELSRRVLVPEIWLAVFRSIYLDAVPATVLPHDAAAVLYDTIVRFLHLGLRTILVLALVFWGRPTGKVVLGLTLLLQVVLAIIEFLGRQRQRSRSCPWWRKLRDPDQGPGRHPGQRERLDRAGSTTPHAPRAADGPAPRRGHPVRHRPPPATG